MNYSPDLTEAAVKMVIALVVVLAVVWAVYRIARKIMPAARGTGSGKLIRVVENQYLGIKKNLLMVQVPGALLVLGVTADKIQMLTRLDDPEIIARIDTEIDHPKATLNFKSQLQRLMGSRYCVGAPLQNDPTAE